MGVDHIMKKKDCIVDAIVTRPQRLPGLPLILQVGTVIKEPYKQHDRDAHYYTLVQFDKGLPVEIAVARLQLEGVPHTLSLVIG